MTTPRLEGQRIRLGTFAAASVTSTYEVIQLPIQSDQDAFLCPWLVRGRDSQPPIRARISDMLDLTQVEDGFYECNWRASYWTFGMVAYWNATVLGGGLSPAVTIMTYDATNTAVFVQCTTRKLQFPRDGEPRPGGWGNITIPFVGGVIVA